MTRQCARCAVGESGRSWARASFLPVARRLARPLAVGALLALTACGVRGSGTAATQTRQVGEFTEIEASGVIHLRLGLQEPRALQLSGDDNLLPLVTTEVSGKRLVIGNKQDLSPKLDLVATVSAPDVTLVRCSGACEVEVSNVKNDKLALELSGAGSISASGETKELAIDVSGAGKATVEQLRASTITVRLSGAGDVRVGPADKLDADVSGAGAVIYDGNPTVTKHVSGAGNVSHK
jgi:hypothetical protein